MSGIKGKIVLFYKKLEGDTHHRFRSWEHCYNYFQTSNLDIDTACLHLGFYLASWGMYRGSSILLQKDYLVHKGAVTIITQKKYGALQAVTIEKLLNDKQVFDSLFELIGELKGCYESLGISPTNTLLTKILLGTTGCIPAYDRFFIDGLRKRGLSYSKLNKKNFKSLIEFCKINVKEFEDAQNYIPKEKDYPVMKLVDMYFWSLGEEKEIRDKLKNS